MSLPSLTVIARQLSEADINRLLVLKRNLETLEVKRREIAEQLVEVDRQIAALTGGKASKKRGRKPGRPAKVSAAPAKRGRGRPPKKKRSQSAKAAGAPARRGRPPKAKPAAKVGRPRKRPALSGAARAAMLARMAKARAAWAAKRKAMAKA